MNEKPTMPPTARVGEGFDPDGDYGRSPQSLQATLAISKVKSKAEDPPLPPPIGPRVLSRYWLTRFYLSLSLLIKGGLIFYEPNAFVHQVLLGNRAGWFFMSALLLLSIIGVLDAVINDILPPGYSFPWARESRHWVYTLMASSLMCLTYAILKERGFQSVMLMFWIDAAAAVSVANFDLFARRRREF